MRALCAVPDCGTPRDARGFCKRHYMRWRKYGDPTASSTKPACIDVLRHLAAIETDDCTLWPLGASMGYGSVYVDGRIRDTHRVVCEWTHGDPPEGAIHAAHRCGVPLCINPRHIRWATPKENAADRLIHGTHNRGTRCGSNILTEDQVRCIRSTTGLSQRLIAEQYGVSEGTVRSIIIRRNWAWLQ